MGAGIFDIEATKRTTASVIPDGVRSSKFLHLSFLDRFLTCLSIHSIELIPCDLRPQFYPSLLICRHVPPPNILQVRWIQAPAAAVSPEDNKVTLSSGESIIFDYLVVATGVQCDWSKVPGLTEALEKGPESGVCSNYREF